MCTETYPTVHRSSRSDIIHGSWVVKYVFLSVCHSVTLIFRILQKATGQSFRLIKLQIFASKVQGPTGYPFWRLGGWDPHKGLFLPPQNAPAKKKRCRWLREIVWNIFPLLKQNFWWQNFWPGTPLSGAIDQNVRRNFAKISKTLYAGSQLLEISIGSAARCSGGRCHASLTVISDAWRGLP